MTLLEWPTFSLFEYEYDLAKREASALLGAEHTEITEGIVVPAAATSFAVDHLTYFAAVVENERRFVTTQSRIERVHREITGRRGQRQSTRYLVHDMHEYKGKFNPQMARALINVFGTHADVVIDPFAGSGTTLIEAARLGKDAVGTDRNPLAAWMARVKAAVSVCHDPEQLLLRFNELVASIDLSGVPVSADPTALWKPPVLAYLTRWYSAGTLASIASVLTTSRAFGGLPGELVALAVSNVAREVSYQNPADLRVRRLPEGREPAALSAMLPAALEKIRLALEEQVASGDGMHRAAVIDVLEADAAGLPTLAIDSRKVIVTSPPYATALPYVDTDRLSILLLGLAEAEDVRRLDRELIGSREWGQHEAKVWKLRLRDDFSGLPKTVTRLCREIETKNAHDGAGFRREAVPALLYRYFTQMRDAMAKWAEILAQGERAVLVVGENRTGKGEGQTTIPTPQLLADCGTQVGFEVEELIPFQVWPRYGIHGKNGVPGEFAVVLARR